MTEPTDTELDELRQANSGAADLRDALINIAREIEALKRECGMNPESPIAIQNGRYMALSYKVRALAAGQATAAQQGAVYAALPEPFIGVQDRPWGGHAEVIRSAIGEEGVVSCFNPDQMRAFADATHALRASHGQAPATLQSGEQPLPLLVKDIAADLATTPIQVCMALSALGFGGHSVNMAVTPTMAQALRAHFSATEQAAPAAAGNAVVGCNECHITHDLGACTTAAPAAVAGPVAFTAEHVTYIRRYGGSCRDCADENGVCPNRGLPCTDSEKAIRFVLEALAYGINHGYIAAPTTQPSPASQWDALLAATSTALEVLQKHRQMKGDWPMGELGRRAAEELQAARYVIFNTARAAQKGGS